MQGCLPAIQAVVVLGPFISLAAEQHNLTEKFHRNHWVASPAPGHFFSLKHSNIRLENPQYPINIEFIVVYEFIFMACYCQFLKEPTLMLNVTLLRKLLV